MEDEQKVSQMLKCHKTLFGSATQKEARKHVDTQNLFTWHKHKTKSNKQENTMYIV